MSDAPERLFCWNFLTKEGGWDKGWGGYCRPEHLHPIDERERKTGGVYVHNDLFTKLEDKLVECEARLEKAVDDETKVLSELGLRFTITCLSYDLDFDDAFQAIVDRGVYLAQEEAEPLDL